MAGSALWNVCRVIATNLAWDLCCVSPVFYRPVCVVFLYSKPKQQRHEEKKWQEAAANGTKGDTKESREEERLC